MPILKVLSLSRSKDFHRSAKASWLPVFNSASLEISSKEMNVGADRLAAILSRAANEGRELNIWRQFGHMTMDVVGSAAFGCGLSPVDRCTSETPDVSGSHADKGPGIMAHGGSQC